MYQLKPFLYKIIIISKMSKLFWIPIVAFTLCQTTFLSTSIGVIFQRNISSPYISEGGTYPPGCCIFSQIINLSSILIGVIIYVRYRQIERLLYHHDNLIRPLAKKNLIALYIGLAACFGLSMVANFQLTKVPTVHYFGAISCFGLGTIYFWLQGVISYWVQSYIGSIQMAYTRLLMAFICTCSFFVSIFASCRSIGYIFNEEMPKSCRYKHISALAEWIIATLFCLYMLSFTNEFKKIIIDRPIIILVNFRRNIVRLSVSRQRISS